MNVFQELLRPEMSVWRYALIIGALSSVSLGHRRDDGRDAADQFAGRGRVACGAGRNRRRAVPAADAAAVVCSDARRGDRIGFGRAGGRRRESVCAGAGRHDHQRGLGALDVDRPDFPALDERICGSSGVSVRQYPAGDPDGDLYDAGAGSADPRPDAAVLQQHPCDVVRRARSRNCAGCA